MRLFYRAATLAAAAFSVLAITACDPQRISELKEGVSTEADVRDRFGAPENVWDEPGGARTFEYNRQPAGQVNYMITIGPDGRMTALRQVLTPENFARVSPGMRMDEVRRLLEYEQMKMAAMRLGQLPQYGRDFLKAQVYIEQSLQPRFPDVHVVELQDAWRDILKRAKLVQHHKITREELSVREYMSMVLKTLQGRRFVEFEELFEPEKGSTVLVVTFIALLELAKETLIEITQAEAFAPIYVRLAYVPA